MRYQEVKKLLKELDDLSDHFDSVILAQDSLSENNITSSSSDQNNTPINNSKSIPAVILDPRWEFIQDKDLYDEEKKLLQHVLYEPVKVKHS